MHWVLVVINMEKKLIRFCDSLGSNSSKGALSLVPSIILRYLKDEWDNKKRGNDGEMNWGEWGYDFDQSKIPQQLNGYDCGIFVFFAANYISKNQELTYSQADIDTIRPKLILLLLGKWKLTNDCDITRINQDG